MTSFRIPEIDIDILFQMVRKKALRCILPGLFAAVVLFLFATRILPPQFTTATRIFVVNKNDPYFASFLDLRSSGMIARDLGSMLVNDHVTGSVIREMGLSLTPEKLSEMIEVTRIRDTSILEISVTNNDLHTSVEIANRIREKVIAEGSSIMGIEAVHTIYAADEDHFRRTPNANRVLVMSILSGAMVSIMTILVFYERQEQS